MDGSPIGRSSGDVIYALAPPRPLALLAIRIERSRAATGTGYAKPGRA